MSTSASLDDTQRDAGYNRSACTECQRRKQKCNREWPCDRCQKRKIADECRYNSNPTLETPAHELTDKPKRTQKNNACQDTAKPVDNETGVGFDALANRLYATLGIDQGVSEQPASKQDYVAADSSPQMQKVLKLLPQRQSMDILMQTFLNDINYHYYIIYPPMFLQEYHIWWDRRLNNRSLSLQYTCLLAIICACALQHVENNAAEAFEKELGDTLDIISEQLHAAMRELASVIPVGHYHFLNVQRLAHSCYWYKAEAKFLEAWHVLSAAILEARELGYHKEPAAGTVSDFDIEMRRRLWCILDTWDWQISSGLSRPKIIDRTGCDAELPELTLEGHIVSPLLHMKMQSALTRKLASRFSAPKNIITPEEVNEYKVIIEDWMDQFPPEYAFDNPDTSKDQKCSWIFAHRFYVYTMACLLILNPIRHYMVKAYTWESPVDELNVRDIGVWYSLKLMKTLRLWVNKVYNRDGRLHFIIFSIFDTAAILCTAIVKDTDRTIANRQEVLSAIGDAVDMLKKLNTISKTSKTSYDILERLVRRLPETVPRQDLEHQAKRAKVKSKTQPRPALETIIPVPQASAPILTPARHPQQAPMPLAASIPTEVLSADSLSSSTSAPVPTGVGGVLPTSQYAAHEYVQQPMMHPVPQTSCIAANDLAASMDSNGGHCVDERHGWSTSSESTPPSMDEHLAPAFPAINDAVAINSGIYQQQAVIDPGPEFDIESLTPAQMGELAPLWSWHSENLDLANMPPPTNGPDHY